MSMEDSAAQDVRQDSPVYEEMINATSRVANSVLREYERWNNGATDCGLKMRKIFLLEETAVTDYLFA